jgi:hypothetical protein
VIILVGGVIEDSTHPTQSLLSLCLISGGYGRGQSTLGDGAVGPPRSGFVLRLCIRKADEATLRPRSATALRIRDSADAHT